MLNAVRYGRVIKQKFGTTLSPEREQEVTHGAILSDAWTGVNANVDNPKTLTIGKDSWSNSGLFKGFNDII